LRAARHATRDRRRYCDESRQSQLPRDRHHRLFEERRDAIEPVSATAKRKLENGEQRPAPETYPARAEIPRITDQRQGSASVTRGNAAGSHTPGNITPETRLPGWGTWIRTKIDGVRVPRRVLVCHPSSPVPGRAGSPSLSFQPDICGAKQSTQACSSLVRQY
jgi:hypothetical protein